MSQAEDKNGLHFASKQEANNYLEKLKSAIPETVSKYKASGKMPIVALPSMAIGALLGAPLGMAAGFIVAAIGTGIFVLAILLLKFLTSIQVLFYIIAIIVGLAALAIALGTYFATYYSIGSTCGAFVNYMGRLAKNRSTRLTSIFSALSAIIAVPLMFWLIQFLAFKYMTPGALRDTLTLFGDGIPGEQWSIWALVNLAIGSCVAAYSGFESGSKEYKFCEECVEFMAVTPLDAATTSSLADTIQRLAPESPLTPLQQSNIDQSGSLFHCAQCHQGFLDMTLDFLAAFPEGKKDNVEKLEESWLAFSTTLNPGQTQTLHQKIKAVG